MFEKVFRVIDINYTKGDRNIDIHVEGQTVKEAVELLDEAMKRIDEIANRHV